MRIGYPCLNLSLNCKGNRTFRLRSYSEERLIATVRDNLACLGEILRFNLAHKILFFRITSDLVPFASHSICRFDWQSYFSGEFAGIGRSIKSHGMRISMHPDQFTLINSPSEQIFRNSCRELLYHAEVLDLLQLDRSAKIQIHVGGVYGDKQASIERFIERFAQLDERIKRRLVIENDERSYSLADCLLIHRATAIPVVFDLFHHELNSSGESVQEAFSLFTKTWDDEDGLPIVDYSFQEEGERRGKHAGTLDPERFQLLLAQTQPFDFDIMLELKDKERSALRAIELASSDQRFLRQLAG